ncbi:NLI interacting factor-like phosphatase, putative [Plasmodium gallinaceum]|uniref:protein-serine/threonine phosphatase n=1 Tax=Plasmodium gallinaceum TaxID=5849 RepID=A0A1J1GRJ7_PLAGA|nr:NLI interacting factor-like phosphatase, putative [Plasmodium gallinaceum]CRG93912.1 NLI interacting factor-like phosphatase, putative [Plasmodium gallinaceum]
MDAKESCKEVEVDSVLSTFEVNKNINFFDEDNRNMIVLNNDDREIRNSDKMNNNFNEMNNTNDDKNDNDNIKDTNNIDNYNNVNSCFNKVENINICNDINIINDNNNNNNNNNMSNENNIYNNAQNISSNSNNCFYTYKENYCSDLDTNNGKTKLLNKHSNKNVNYNNYNKSNHNNFSINKNFKNFRNKFNIFNKNAIKQNNSKQNINKENNENEKNENNENDDSEKEMITNNNYYDDFYKRDVLFSTYNNQGQNKSNYRNFHENKKLKNNNKSNNNDSYSDNMNNGNNDTNNENNNNMNINNNDNSINNNVVINRYDQINSNNSNNIIINTNKKRRVAKYDNFYKNKQKKNYHKSFNDNIKRFNNNSINLTDLNNNKNDSSNYNNEKQKYQNYSNKNSNLNFNNQNNEEGNMRNTFMKENYNTTKSANRNNNNNNMNYFYNNMNKKNFNNLAFSLNKYFIPFKSIDGKDSRNVNNENIMNKNKLINKNINLNNNNNNALNNNFNNENENYNTNSYEDNCKDKNNNYDNISRDDIYDNTNNYDNNYNYNNSFKYDDPINDFNGSHKNNIDELTDLNKKNNNSNINNRNNVSNNFSNLDMIAQNFNLEFLKNCKNNMENELNTNNTYDNEKYMKYQGNNVKDFNIQNYIECLSEVSEISDEEEKDYDLYNEEPNKIMNGQYDESNNNSKSFNVNNFHSGDATSPFDTNLNQSNNNKSELMNDLYKFCNYNRNINTSEEVNHYYPNTNNAYYKKKLKIESKKGLGDAYMNNIVTNSFNHNVNYSNDIDLSNSPSSSNSSTSNHKHDIDKNKKKKKTVNSMNASDKINNAENVSYANNKISNYLGEDQNEIYNQNISHNLNFLKRGFHEKSEKCRNQNKSKMIMENDNSYDSSCSDSSINYNSVDLGKESVNDKKNKLSLNQIKTEDLFINSYMPYPPEKYNNIYELHEIKILSPHILKTKFQKEGKTYHSTLKDGKLILLLDLDNTLLQATSFAKFNMDLPLENFVDENGEAQLYKFFLPSYNFFYYLKFRPYVRQFLQILSLYYELSVYTNATREYADVVIAILDPDRTLFSDRIVARCSSTDRDENKHFSRIYPNIDSKYVIAFDDRKDVWSDIPQSHILKAEHYNFFELSKYDILSHFKESSTCKKKFLDMDMHLYYMTKVFLKLHKKFFEKPLEVDVGKLIEEIMSDTLKNVGVYFTGFRKNSKNAQNVLSADCEERQKEMALELGAKIYSNYDLPGVTHIIAAKNCTDNLIKSKKSDYNHIYKVHTLWLYHCRGTLENVDWSHFDADELCKIYNNKPPLHPKKDHWFFGNKHLRKQDDMTDCVKIENLKSRIFLGTGEYTHDAVIFSPFEQIHIKWIEKEVKLRQNYDTSYNTISNDTKSNEKNQINDDYADDNYSYDDNNEEDNEYSSTNSKL